MIPRPRASALLALAGLTACGGAAPPIAPKAKPAGLGLAASVAKPKAARVDVVTPSRLLPDLIGQRGVVSHEDGYRRVLIDRMRLIAREDGSLERASELLPLGTVNAVALPSRLGGGFLFHANTSGGTQIWRAPSWLAKLRPLIQLSAVANEVIPGFDRLYVRLSTNNRLTAIDPDSGEPRSLSPLPPAATYGKLAVADGWRAVVDTDLRGPLATFDAGVTWRSVGIAERPQDITLQAGDPAIFVAGGRYLISARGLTTFRPDAPRGSSPSDAGPSDDIDVPSRPAGPFGRRPLRAALEDGWPDSPDTAVVARGGALARVSLQDGAILATAEEAYPDRLASCHALRLGAGFGFLCGERDGPTTLYAFSPPFAMKPVMRFARPRFVASSGNGALVIRGGCTDVSAALGSERAYCVRDPAGKTREIRIKGDLGVERVVALADGRIAVLVPPRGGSPGQLTLLTGDAAKSVALRLPGEPRSVVRNLAQGMWLDGFEEREKGVLSGWVEAGGPVLGVRIDLDGKVTVGDLRDDAGGAILSGRFGLSLGDGGRAAETTDGGMHWEVLDLPERDEDGPQKNATRACGPAGCVVGGWLRVGWGKPGTDDDLHPADPPSAPYFAMKISPTIGFSCEVGASVTPPAPASPPKTPPPALRGAVRHFGKGPPAAGPSTITGWSLFRNTPPPTLGADEVGIDNGTSTDLVMMRAYAWGKKGADWIRAGRWQVRFDDRFDATGGVRQSAATTSFWPDEAAAVEAIGTGSYGAASWGAYLDPSGRAVLANACRGSTCAFYAVGDGQPVLPIRDASGRTSAFYRPFPSGAVRVGETWFFVTQGPVNEAVALYRVDLGVARQLGVYYRPVRYGIEAPRMVRRALSGAVGLLVGSAAEPGERVGSWYVLPVNPDTGVLGEAVALTRRDYAGRSFDRCSPWQDGWVMDVTFETPTVIDLASSSANFDGVEMRARMDPGVVCLDGLAARIDGVTPKVKPGPGAPPAPRPLPAAAASGPADDAAVIPLSATERGTGRRWAMTCRQKRAAIGPR